MTLTVPTATRSAVHSQAANAGKISAETSGTVGIDRVDDGKTGRDWKGGKKAGCHQDAACPAADAGASAAGEDRVRCCQRY